MVAFDSLFEKLQADASQSTLGESTVEKIQYLGRIITDEIE
jgi:hypothetical protein